MRNRSWALVVLAVYLLSPSLHAQWPSGDGGPGDRPPGGPGGRGGMPGRPPGPRMEFPSAEELGGPLTPTAMGRVADLDSAGMARYAEQYGPHMAATATVRDSIRSMLRSLDERRESGDREAMRTEMRARGPVVSRHWKDLSKRDKQFYKDVTKTFTKDERKKFEQWQDDKEKSRKAERRFGPGGGERPGWTSR